MHTTLLRNAGLPRCCTQSLYVRARAQPTSSWSLFGAVSNDQRPKTPLGPLLCGYSTAGICHTRTFIVLLSEHRAMGDERHRPRRHMYPFYLWLLPSSCCFIEEQHPLFINPPQHRVVHVPHPPYPMPAEPRVLKNKQDTLRLRSCS